MTSKSEEHRLGYMIRTLRDLESERLKWLTEITNKIQSKVNPNDRFSILASNIKTNTQKIQEYKKAIVEEIKSYFEGSDEIAEYFGYTGIIKEWEGK